MDLKKLVLCVEVNGKWKNEIKYFIKDIFLKVSYFLYIFFLLSWRVEIWKLIYFLFDFVTDEFIWWYIYYDNYYNNNIDNFLVLISVIHKIHFKNNNNFFFKIKIEKS